MLHFGFCLVHQDKEERHKHMIPNTMANIIPKNTPVPMAWRLAEPGPLANTIGSIPKYKGEGSHQDRPETELGSMDGRLYQVSSLVNLHLGKLHNQNGILCRKPHQHHQADLEINIILQSAYPRRPDRHPKRQPAVKAIQR